MKRVSLFGALALFVIVLLAGCGGGSKLVGTWEKDGNTFTFNGDNTFSAEASQGMGPGVRMAMSGTYTIKEDNKSMTFTITKGSITGLPAEQQAQSDAFIQTLLNKPQASTLEWKTDDELTVTEASGTKTTYKRKK